MSVLKVKQHDLKISRNSEINKAISIYKANNLWVMKKIVVSEMFSLRTQGSVMSTKL